MRARLGFLIAFAALTATGCSGGVGKVAEAGDMGQGKQLFTAKCASCHVLKDAGASGKVGPDLDASFGSDRAQGIEESTIRQVVADQIQYAGDYGTEGPTMPVDLVTGENVDDVASYVAAVAGRKTTGTSTGGTMSGGGMTTTTGTTTSGGGGDGGSSLAAGKQAYNDNGCGACHSLGAAGSSGAIGPDLDKIKGYAKTANQPLEAFILASIVKPDDYVEKGFPKGVMPHTFASLPKATLDALVAFIADSAKG